jgi:hypothetical protein
MLQLGKNNLINQEVMLDMLTSAVGAGLPAIGRSYK